jgi:hypothetical protein
MEHQYVKLKPAILTNIVAFISRITETIKVKGKPGKVK